MIHLSQSRSSIIFAHDGDSLEVLYWGKKLGAIDKAAAESIRAARTKPAFHGGLDVAPGNLILREHARGWIGHPALRGHRGGVNAEASRQPRHQISYQSREVLRKPLLWAHFYGVDHA